MRTSFTVVEVDDTVKEQIEAEHAKWEADLRLSKGSLMVDQHLIQKTEVGSWALPGTHGGPCPIHRGHEAHPPVLRNGGLVRCAGYP